MSSCSVFIALGSLCLLTANVMSAEITYKNLPKPVGANSESIFVELLLFLDLDLHQSRFHEQLQISQQRLRLLVANLNHVMQPLNVYVYLNSRHIVNIRNEMNVTSADSTKEALAKFSKFIVDSKNRFGIFDHAMLLSGNLFRNEGGDVQTSYLGGICWLDSSVSVVTEYFASSDFREVVYAMAYALARNLGIEDDYADRAHECMCAVRPCVMNSYKRRSSHVEWSSCSKDFLKRARLLGRHYCLNNLPRLAVAPHKSTLVIDVPAQTAGNTSRTVDISSGLDDGDASGSGDESATPNELRSHEAVELVTSRCGNGFVEPGEQCDCGLPEYCSKEARACCDPSTCKLTTNATCAVGECCDTASCRLKPSGSMCRPPITECDLPEYCSGSSEQCPTDVFKQSGTSCSLSAARCHNGLCRSLDLQCRRIYGETAFAATASFWFSNLPPLSSKDFGCGHGKACANDSDIECGRLFCQHEAEKPVLFYAPPHWLDDLSSKSGNKASFATATDLNVPGATVNLSLFITHRTETRSGNRAVREAAYVVVNPMPGADDPGFVEDGTPCGALVTGNAELRKGVCMSRTCVFEKPSFKCTSRETCHGRGICNSADSCHCDFGFAPPFCNVSGNGGSLQSGPAPDAVPGLTNEEDDSIETALVLSILLTALFCLVLSALAVVFRRKLQIWYYTHIWAAPKGRTPSFLVGKDSVIRVNLSKVQRKWAGASLAATPTMKRTAPPPPEAVLSEPCTAKSQNNGPTPRRSFRGLEISTPVLKHSTLTKEKLDSLKPLDAVQANNMASNPEAASLITSDAQFSESDDEKMVSPDLIQSTYPPSTVVSDSYEDNTDTTSTSQQDSAELKHCSVPKRPAPRTPQQNRMAIKVSFSVPERLSNRKIALEGDESGGV